jgi:beta-glucosidase
MKTRSLVSNFFFALVAAIVLFAGSMAVAQSSAPKAEDSASRPWMNRSLSAKERANLLIHAMTLDEKILMIHGAARKKGAPPEPNAEPTPKGYVGYVPPIRRLGIPALRLADGRAGVGNDARNVTLLPAPIAAASSWNPELINEFGKVLGEEQWKKGTNVALGPSIDVLRVPEWGRSFESYGEDPCLNARMAVAEIHGIQSQGPIADANMYLTMNQESDRFKEDSVVDERTMHEIYLPPFAAAVEEGHVGTFMCAYVKTNGVYSCESADLLTDILRKQLHFGGWVMSDWGATHSTVDAAKNGLDQQMPDDEFYGAALKKAVEDGQVSMDLIDEHVRHILVPMFQHGLFEKPQTASWDVDVRSPEHAAFSRRVAEEGTVLLKNEGALLPLETNQSIAVIGEAGGNKPKAEGGGSSAVIPPYIVSPLDGIRKRMGAGAQVAYAAGSDLGEVAKTAGAVRTAIVFVHTNETEGADRPNLELPDNQDKMIEAAAGANPRTIVVLDTGGAVLMPWINQVAGVIEAWYPGQEDGNAIAAVLFGDVNPGAKLPLTIPRTATEVPTAQPDQWPGVGGRSLYTEKLNVGYRWYDATNTQPLFPFGFGLSYTTFKVSHLVVTPAKASTSALPHTNVEVKVDVTNTGHRKGAEVVEVYVGDPPENGEPPHQLRAFEKVKLAPGATKTVSLPLDRHTFAIYNTDAHQWKLRAGTYQILAGTSSRDLPLSGSISISGK